MEYWDILGFAGIIVGLSGFLAPGKHFRRVLFFVAMVSLLIYSLIRPIYPFTFLLVIAIGYLIYQLYIFRKSKASIKLLEVEFDNNYIVEFIKNYKRDIYNYFPFYEPAKNQKCFLVMRDMNLAGVMIASISDDVMTIEVDYIKPMYRDSEIGTYIYKQNPGHFKKLGVNKLIAKSYHKGHSRFLQKMGFEKSIIDNQPYFVKNLD